MKEEDDLQLILTWRDHKQVLSLVMETLRYKELFADVTLICGEKQYAVHKFVLCTCSPYFEELLECVPCEHPVLVLTETSHETLEALLDFMYLGQTDFCSKDLDRLLDLAYEFRIKGLISPKDEADRQKLEKDSVKQELSEVMPDKTTLSKELKKGSVQQELSSVITDDTKSSKSIQEKSDKDGKIVSGENDKGSVKGGKVSDKTKLEERNLKKSPKIYACKNCNKTFGEPVQLEKHMVVHIEEKLLSCPECLYRTLSKVTLSKHILTHVKKKAYSCPYCPDRHCLEKQHVLHQRRMHPQMKVVINESSVPGLGKSLHKKPKVSKNTVKEKVMSLSLLLQKIHKSSESGFSPLQTLESNASNRVSPSPSPTAKALISPISSASLSLPSKVPEFTRMSPSLPTPSEMAKHTRSNSSPLLPPPAKVRRICRNSTSPSSPSSPSRIQKKSKSSSSSLPPAEVRTSREIMSSSSTQKVPKNAGSSTSASSVVGKRKRLSISPSPPLDSSRSSSCSSSSIKSPEYGPSPSPPPSKYVRSTRSNTVAESLRRQSRAK
nr:zinc finger protein 236-like [Cherax quadricarinatus]